MYIDGIYAVSSSYVNDILWHMISVQSVNIFVFIPNN